MGTIIIIIIIIIAVIIIIIISQVLLTSASYCGLHVRAVSVFGKKSDAVCGFFGVFLCGFSVSDPPYAPLQELVCYFGNWLFSLALPRSLARQKYQP